MRLLFCIIWFIIFSSAVFARQDSLYIDFSDLLDEGFPIESISEITFNGANVDSMTISLTDNSQRHLSLDQITELTFKAPPGYTVPVELVSLNGRVEESVVCLNWSTRSETNNAGFEVQQYWDGKWQRLGFVPGKGTTTESQTYTYQTTVESNSLQFRLKQLDLDGSFSFSTILTLDANPMVFSLSQNYPNPFNPSTTIVYQVPRTGNVTIELFDVLGRRISELFAGEVQAGKQSFLIDAGALKLASGVYFIRVQYGNQLFQKRVDLVK